VAVAAAGALAQGTAQLWAQQVAPGAPLVLSGGQLLDGFETPPLQDAAVVLRGDRIAWVGPMSEVEVPAGARVIDTSGGTVMPGLIDAHVHVDLIGHGDYDAWYRFIGGTARLAEMAEIASRQMVRAGITTAVDLGAPLEVGRVRERIESGEIPGPRLLLSGPWITRITLDGVPLEYQRVIGSPAEAAREARALLDGGADHIKVWAGLTEEDYRAVVEAAEERDARVHAHLYEPGAIRAAMRAGVHVFHHVGSGGNPPYDQDLVREVAHRGIPVIQTIAHRIWVYPATVEFPGRLRDPAMRDDLPADVWGELQRSFRDFRRLSYFDTTPRQIRNAPVAARQWIEAGAVIGVGTDAASPLNFHTEAMWREMVALVESGMTPLQVISAATKTNAEILGLAGDRGTLEPGKLADVLVVQGNPLADIETLSRVALVVRGGAVIR
jgi:imidazolonepropionase-like amidohydrolase